MNSLFVEYTNIKEIKGIMYENRTIPYFVFNQQKY